MVYAHATTTIQQPLNGAKNKHWK